MTKEISTKNIREEAPKTLKEMLTESFTAYYSNAERHEVGGDVAIDAPSCWDMQIKFPDSKGRVLIIENLRSENLPLINGFRDQLSPKSREMFCPYPWDDEEGLREALTSAAGNAINRRDASYIIRDEELPVGHFFLWKAGGNPASEASGVEVPELGVAIADDYQGRGLGLLSVKVLQAVAKSLNCDAIELTTALSNDAGWGTYLKAGFEYTSNIRNPLEVDVTAVDQGSVVPKKYREERQMVYMINGLKEKEVLDYLKSKRQNNE